MDRVTAGHDEGIVGDQHSLGPDRFPVDQRVVGRAAVLDPDAALDLGDGTWDQDALGECSMMSALGERPITRGRLLGTRVDAPARRPPAVVALVAALVWFVLLR